MNSVAASLQAVTAHVEQSLASSFAAISSGTPFADFLDAVGGGELGGGVADGNSTDCIVDASKSASGEKAGVRDFHCTPTPGIPSATTRAMRKKDELPSYSGSVQDIPELAAVLTSPSLLPQDLRISDGTTGVGKKTEEPAGISTSDAGETSIQPFIRLSPPDASASDPVYSFGGPHDGSNAGVLFNADGPQPTNVDRDEKSASTVPLSNSSSAVDASAPLEQSESVDSQLFNLAPDLVARETQGPRGIGALKAEDQQEQEAIGPTACFDSNSANHEADRVSFGASAQIDLTKDKVPASLPESSVLIANRPTPGEHVQPSRTASTPVAETKPLMGNIVNTSHSGTSFHTANKPDFNQSKGTSSVSFPEAGTNPTVVATEASGSTAGNSFNFSSPDTHRAEANTAHSTKPNGVDQKTAQREKPAAGDAIRNEGQNAPSVAPPEITVNSSQSAPTTSPTDNSQPGATHGFVPIQAASTAQLSASHPANSGPKPASDVPNYAEAAADSIRQPVSASVQSARILQNSNQSEMHVGLRTESFGNIQVHTTIADKQVDVALGSERGDLRGLMNSELPILQSALHDHDFRLQQLRTIVPSQWVQSGAFADSSGQHHGSHQQGAPFRMFQTRGVEDEHDEVLLELQRGLSVRA